MSDTVPPLPSPAVARPSAGRIVGGVSFLLGWAVIHVILFYLLAGGGIVIEILLSIVKSIMFPGRNFTQNLDASTWSTSLNIGVVLAGLAGIPAASAIVWRQRRKTLLLWFVIALLAGIVWEAVALYRFVGDALST